ncbi:MAG: SPOR domain-containing protein [bacterium]
MKNYFILLIFFYFPLIMFAQKTLEPKSIEVKKLNSNAAVLRPREIKNNNINKQILSNVVKHEEKIIEPIKVIEEEKKTPILNKELFIPKSYIYNSAKEKKIKGTIYSDGSLYCYQVGAYKSQKVAKGEVDKLKKKGFSVYISEYKIAKKPTWYRVRIGDFDTLQETEISLKMYNKLIKK